MADGIEKILRDPKLRKEFSKESLAIAKTHDLDNTIDAFVDLYERTIEAKRQEIADRPAGFVDRIKESEFREYMDFWSSNDEK
jgi:hypothetical protein